MTKTAVEAPPDTEIDPDILREKMGEARIYIVLRERIARRDLGHSMLSIAHAMMAAAHKWQACEHFQVWRTISFRKFLGLAGDKEWQKMGLLGDLDKLVMHECGVEGNPEMSMIFAPLAPDEVPNVLKHLRPLSWKTLVPAHSWLNASQEPRAAPIGVWAKPRDNAEPSGDLMPLQDWHDCVFDDYDGYGHPCKDDKMDGELIIKPSAAKYDIPEGTTHVMWYNN